VLLSLVNTNLFASFPYMKTVGLPKRVSIDIEPYFCILSRSHFSAVLVLIALRSCRLWPIMGIPSEPGGSFLDDFLPLIRRKMGKRTIKMVKSGFIWAVWGYVFGRSGGCAAAGGVCLVTEKKGCFLE